MKSTAENPIKLIPVPSNQKKWFRKEYDTIKSEVLKSECIDYDMLENNIFGINDRFINWNLDLDSIVDCYIQNYMLQEDRTEFITDCLICCLEDCKELEYFEIAHNLTLLLNSFELSQSEYKKEQQEWYTKK